MYALELEQILSQVIAFIVMLWVMKRFAWKPLLSVMEERRQTIQSEFNKIEEKKKRVAAQIDLYNQKLEEIDNEARAKIQEEVNKGKEIVQNMHAQAKRQTQELLNKTQQEIQREMEKAKIQMKNEMVDLVITTTQKLMHKELDQPDKQKALIQKIIEQTELK